MFILYEIEGVGFFHTREEFEKAIKAHAEAHPERQAELEKQIRAMADRFVGTETWYGDPLDKPKGAK